MLDQQIRNFLQNTGAKLVLVSYSPTGGGHTARLLNIIHMALETHSLPQHSMVILHIPCIWENTPRPVALKTLSQALIDKGIPVWLAESDKAIYGYLNKETGGSDDASILQRISHFPQRNASATHNAGTSASVSSLRDCLAYKPGMEFTALPVISAKDLMSSISRLFPREVMENRCYVLTDMDPYLQKAAALHGVPGKRRVDQQNHAILLNLTDSELNLLPKYALLAKVLGGTRESVSHIALGGKNTLNSLTQITGELKIYSGTPKAIARAKVAELLMSFALDPLTINEKLKPGAPPFSGVIAGNNLRYGGAATHIIYVYAHKKTSLIAASVWENIKKNEPAFSTALFLFCGPNAVGKYNAMHLAYIADADGITTAGAGTVGEFTYLRKVAGCGSRLLILPIEGHNEQEANADYISGEPGIKAFVVRTLEKEQLSATVSRFVNSASKYKEAPMTMHEFFAAISDSSSYVQQGKDILFSATPDPDFSNIEKIEQLMNQSALLRATRKYLKLVFQGLSATEQTVNHPIVIQMKESNGKNHVFENVKQFNYALNSNAELGRIIEMPAGEDIGQMPLLQEVKRHFSCLVHSGRADAPLGNKLKEQFGEFMVTGF
ncbi:UDP-N-acetylglucosamine--N-acetylmuramyl-(pentapeptide) pyrophosphoryl-undecaprenol N-acetylglucosamine transferase [Ewingella americana]|uniref:Uncharacterized protein n=1 Tax=Ewingella americana TaxID=41202 RepID=A0A502GC37_9GAMM|nr:UDP-N-acetylglucosamine--N-acetylmuramyl-(pentapeptide) pyrophosphoryl-undecaprenol N-acetylglucosamine transferase [Ewingella americana]TPG59301.1 hypothetical protein EAH77_16950 [Ewingella americana]